MGIRVPYTWDMGALTWESETHKGSCLGCETSWLVVFVFLGGRLASPGYNSPMLGHPLVVIGLGPICSASMACALRYLSTMTYSG